MIGGKVYTLIDHPSNNRALVKEFRIVNNIGGRLILESDAPLDRVTYTVKKSEVDNPSYDVYYSSIPSLFKFKRAIISMRLEQLKLDIDRVNGLSKQLNTLEYYFLLRSDNEQRG